LPRRRLPPWLPFAAAGLLAAGCGGPAGTDGNLVNNWPTQAAASYSPPAAGTCLGGVAFSAFEPPGTGTPDVVDCAALHTVEVVGVGTFSGAIAAATAPPAWDSDGTRAAYADCDRAATTYAGADWHTGRLFPFLSVPREPAWQGGARQFVCGLAEAADDLFAPLTRTGSVRGGLADPRPLALTCVLLDGTDVSPQGFYGSVDAVTPIDCSRPHDTEFVGVWVAPAGPYPDAQRLGELAGDACFNEIAAFLGLSKLQLYQRGDVYTFWNGLTAAQWKLGDRTAHCFLNVASTTLL